MTRYAAALIAAALLWSTPALAWDSINLSYGEHGVPCDSQWHEVEWANPGPVAVSVTKVVMTAVGTPGITGQNMTDALSRGAWYSEIRIEAIDGSYKTIAVYQEQSIKSTAGVPFDYPDGMITVQPGEHVVHRTFCIGTPFFYSWVYVLVK